jgi:hypothetical protein
MDSGEVLHGIEEDWNFMGANIMEWGCGFLAFILISLFSNNPVRAMPFMLSGAVLTTTTLAALRRTYPDEQRGLRNAILTTCGFVPPDIPAPASIQPFWSGAPLKSIPQNTKFHKIGLDRVFSSFERDSSPAEVEPLRRR